MLHTQHAHAIPAWERAAQNRRERAQGFVQELADIISSQQLEELSVLDIQDVLDLEGHLRSDGRCWTKKQMREAKAVALIQNVERELAKLAAHMGVQRHVGDGVYGR